METHVVISNAVEILRIPMSQIVYIQADGNYCNMLLCGGEIKMVTLQLGQIEKLFNEQPCNNERFRFIRIGKSLIINIGYIYLINMTKQLLVMNDWMQGKYTLSASREALKQLKDYIETLK